MEQKNEIPQQGREYPADRQETIKWMGWIIVPLVLALLSFFVLAKYTSSAEMSLNAHTIQSLDDKKTTALELTAAATAASAAITLIPGDVGTPIADKLADLSSYFLIVVCAIYLEKYLVTITGWAAFGLMIPVGLVLLSVCVAVRRETLKALAGKLIVLGLALYLVIPASVKISDMIEATYGASMENTIASAKQTTEEIQKEADSDSSENSQESEEKKGFLSGLADKVETAVSGAKVNLENTLNRFIEAIAVMLVTSCVIPILVLVFFLWIVKLVLGVDIRLPRMGTRKKS